MEKQHKQQILRAIRIGLVFNIFLTVLKLGGGIIGGSQALISDGINSFTDIFISIMLFIALRIASKRPDHDHHYGHEKYEGIAYFVLGIIFILTAASIIYIGGSSLIAYFGDSPDTRQVESYTIWIAGIALVTKLVLYLYYRYINKKEKHPTIQADAKNHLLDAWATLFTLIGVILAGLNMPYFDYIASIIIGLFILKLAIDTIKDAIAFLVDQAPKQEVIQEIRNIILTNSLVLQIDDLKVRKHMNYLYVDLEIAVDATLSLSKAHQIAEEVHHDVEQKMKTVIHCMVHVNPKKN